MPSSGSPRSRRGRSGRSLRSRRHFNRVMFFEDCINYYVVAFKSSLSEDLCDCSAGNFKALGLNIGSRRDRTDFNF